ncbi:stress response protein NST1-like [Rosa rugosa]|uniref:stress response protein NST1-like n=1 Tax=Rosa rugosa TaxID=74645 RepID=UPI002B412936|nr:stress response protein NST1-like [Rosa rugosa]
MAVTTDGDLKTDSADILAAEQKEEEEKMAPVSNVDQPAAVTSVSSSIGSEKISLFIGQFPIRIPSYSEETKTNDQEMNNNVELDLEKDTQGTVMCSTLPVEEINNIINTVLETNQFADVMNIKGIPLVSEANSTVDQAKSNDDEKSEARGNEVIREEEQEELNADAIVLGTTTTTVTSSVPLQEGNNINYVPKANQFADLMNTKESLVVSEAKTTMDQAKNSNDAKDKFEVRKKLTKAKQNAPKAVATKKTENQAQKQKAKAIRIEGYNEFSLLEELENEQELDIEAKRVEEAATTTEEKPHENEFDAESSSEKEQDIEAKRVKEAATIVAVATASTSEEKAHKSESDAQSGSEKEQDVEAKRVEEDAAAKKKREKRKRKKKSKAEKLNGSFPSVGVFSLALN